MTLKFPNQEKKFSKLKILCIQIYYLLYTRKLIIIKIFSGISKDKLGGENNEDRITHFGLLPLDTHFNSTKYKNQIFNLLLKFLLVIFL